MEKQKHIDLFDNFNRLKYLFPNKELHQKIMIETEKFAKRFPVIVGIVTFVAIIISSLTTSIESEYDYLFFNIWIFLIFTILCIIIILIYLPQRKIYKIQYKELKKDKEAYSNQIILHENYNKFLRKWNIIYLFSFIISFGLGIIIFLLELYENKKNTMAPFFIFAFVLLIFIVPLLFFNFRSFRKFRRNQHPIESLIKEEDVKEEEHI